MESITALLSANLAKHFSKPCLHSHKWVQHLGEDNCPYGAAFLEVTFPDSAKLHDMIQKHDPNNTFIIPDNDFVQDDWFGYICAIYGLVVYGVWFISFIELLVRRGTRELNFVLCASVIFIINEGMVKPAMKQPRPEHSCLTSCGMPSGHSAFAIGFFTLNCLDIFFRLNSTWGNAQRYTKWCDCASLRGQGKLCKAMNIFLEKFSVSPLAFSDTLTYDSAITRFFVWGALLLPVPISRIAVQDHTPEQVMIGGLIGMVIACIWTWVVRRLLYKTRGKLGQWYCGCLLQHNYSLPRYLIDRLIAEGEDETVKDLLRHDKKWLESEKPGCPCFTIQQQQPENLVPLDDGERGMGLASSS